VKLPQTEAKIERSLFGSFSSEKELLALVGGDGFEPPTLSV
jgi:hypothetical protein